MAGMAGMVMVVFLAGIILVIILVIGGGMDIQSIHSRMKIKGRRFMNKIEKICSLFLVSAPLIFLSLTPQEREEINREVQRDVQRAENNNYPTGFPAQGFPGGYQGYPYYPSYWGEAWWGDPYPIDPFLDEEQGEALYEEDRKNM